MYNYILKSWVIVLLIISNSCTDQGNYKGRYIIENATEKEVKIKFYKRQRVGVPILILTKEINGPGIIYDEFKTLYSPGDNEIPKDVFGADSLAVIFDSEKIQAHYESIPFENSLSDFGDYMQEGDTNRYIITEENYQNAVDCDGNCN
jgi:hypothetical protein